MKESPWDEFFRKSVETLFVPGTRVLDIGGGMRIDASRGNREDPSRSWIKPLATKCTYHILDAVPTYHPDIVGDVMQMPIEDNAYDGVACLAVLEHVPRPWDAVSEMRRVLRPGGFLFCYVPFLSPYHAYPGYYGDFFRFTDDGIRALFTDFDDLNLQPVRGAAETIAHLLPGRGTFLRHVGGLVDRVRASSGKQASGYFFTARKSA